MKIKTRDHPEANGRKPKAGDVEYTFSFIAETGERVDVEMGREGFETHTQHVLDMLSNAPTYDDGSLPKG